MKKIMFVAVMALASMTSYAQHAVGSLTLQPKVALNIANITDGDGSDPRIGLAAGAELEYQVSDMFSIAGGLLYSMQGATDDQDGADATLKMDYINVPIMANLYVAPNFALKVGVQPGFNVTHKIKGESHGVSAESDFDGAKSFDFSIPLGLSYEFSNVVIDARYNLGLTKIVDFGDSKNSVFQISVGYRFDL